MILSLRLNDEKSWGAREEHRMSLSLLMIVHTELRRRENPGLRQIGTRDPFYVHRTSVVNQFAEQIVLPYAQWYQEILGMSEEGQLGVDRQKLAIMVGSLLKGSYGAALMESHALLWHKKNPSEEDDGKEYVGLGLRMMVERYGFGWLPHDLFDFESNNFASGVADQFPFLSDALRRRYESRKRLQYTVTTVMQDIDLIVG